MPQADQGIVDFRIHLSKSKELQPHFQIGFAPCGTTQDLHELVPATASDS